MSDRIRTLQVVLDRDMPTESVEKLRQVLMSIKGVAAVEAGAPLTIDDYLHRRATLSEFSLMLMELLAMTLSSADDARYKTIRQLIAQSYSEKTGRPLFS